MWEIIFFTSHIFANGPHFVALTQLQATKTGSKNFFRKLIKKILCVRIFWVYAPKNAQKNPSENFREQSDLRKSSVFHGFPCPYPPKKILGSCNHNFDATDLPHSSFEPLYPKLFRGTPEVDLVSTVWPPDLPKVR